MNKIQNKNKKKVIAVSFIAIATLILAVIFVPYIFSKSYAESQYKAVDFSKTKLESKGLLEDIFSPTYVLFSKPENKDARVSFVKLKRKLLLFWDVENVIAQDWDGFASVMGEGSDGMSSANPDGTVDSLHEAYEEGRLTERTVREGLPNVEEINKQALKDYEDLTAPNQVMNDMQSLNGDYKVQVKLGNTPEENYVTINDKRIPQLTNVYGLHFDLDEKNLYYSTYSVKPAEGMSLTTSSGKIYQYNLAKGTIKEVYDFNKKISVSFKVNHEKIAYALSDNEFGVINLETKKKRLIDISQFKDILKMPATDMEIVLINILDIGPTTAVASINEPGTEDVKYIRINLETLKITEE